MGTFLNPYRFAAPAGPSIYKGVWDGTGALESANNPAHLYHTAAGGRSLECWIYFTSLPAVDGVYLIFGPSDSYNDGSGGNFVRFRAQRQIATHTGWRINLQVRSPIVGSVSKRVYGSTELTTGTWYHLVMSTDGTRWQLRLNGSLETLTVVGGFPLSGHWFGDLFGTDPRKSAIGNSVTYGVAQANYATFQIRRLSLWDGELDATDAGALYAEGYNGDPADVTVTSATLDHSWDFTGQDTLDQVGSDDMSPSGAWDDATDIIIST